MQTDITSKIPYYKLGLELRLHTMYVNAMVRRGVVGGECVSTKAEHIVDKVVKASGC